MSAPHEQHELLAERALLRMIRMKHFSRRISSAIISIFIFVLAACSSMEVNTAKKSDVDLSKYKTYSWSPVRQSHGNPQASTLDRDVKTSVDHQLIARGLLPAVDRASADLLVSYSAKSETKYKYGGDYGSGWDGPRTDPFQEGTLAVLLVDPKINRVVWSGRAMFVIGDPREDQKYIRQAAEELFKKYPMT